MNNQFTEEQKKNLKELNRKYSFKTFGLALKCLLTVVLVDPIIISADAFYVHSQAFVLIVSLAAGFLIGQLFIKNIQSLAVDLKSDTLKILEDKSET